MSQKRLVTIAVVGLIAYVLLKNMGQGQGSGQGNGANGQGQRAKRRMA